MIVEVIRNRSLTGVWLRSLRVLAPAPAPTRPTPGPRAACWPGCCRRAIWCRAASCSAAWSRRRPIRCRQPRQRPPATGARHRRSSRRDARLGLRPDARRDGADRVRRRAHAGRARPGSGVAAHPAGGGCPVRREAPPGSGRTLSPTTDQGHDVELVARVLAQARRGRARGDRAGLRATPPDRLRAALRPARRLPVPRGQGPAPGDLLRGCRAVGRPHRAGAPLRQRRSSSSTTRSSSTTTSRTAPSSGAAGRRCSRSTARPSRSTSATRRTSSPSTCCSRNTTTARRPQGPARAPRGRADGPRVGRGPGDRAGLDPGERFDLEDRDYVRMAYKKTCWYTVIAPLRIGVICGSPPGPARAARRTSSPR